jgi:PAS domain S-box-containing protein
MNFQDIPIRRKLTLVVLLTSGLVLFLTCTAFITYEVITLHKNMAQGYETRANILAANSAAALAFEDPADAARVLAALKTDKHVMLACIYDADGNVFATYPDGMTAHYFPDSPTAAGHQYGESSLEVFSAIMQDGRQLGIVYIKADLGTLTDRYRAYAMLTMLVFLSSLLVAFLLSRVFQKQISAPILALAETARAIARDRDFSVRATRQGGGELGLLTDAFNQMLVQTQSSLKDVRDFQCALDEHAIVAITDPQGQITYVNDKFCAISKYSRKELLGQDHRLINSGYHSKDFIRQLWQTIAQGQVWHGEIKNRAKDGTYYWVDTTIVPFLNADGKPYQYVAIRSDITERKRVEDQIQALNVELELRVQERTKQLEAVNQELEAFSYSVSHDLRAPLRHIDGFVDMLRPEADAKLTPTGQRYLKVISAAARRMGSLIDDLLVFSRMGRMEMRRTTVKTNSLVAEVIQEMNVDLKGRVIEWDIGPLPAAYGDRAMLKQVWVNLISNAAKYSRDRSPARIKISHRENDAGEGEYSVQDNGAGFDMQYAGKLFGVFQRLHQAEEFEGTGVGLANVQRIIVRHGGRVWAEGQVDVGATFYFTLPKTINEPENA